MRKFLIVTSIVLFPAVAAAQDATAPAPPAIVPDKPTLSESVPLPRSETGLDGYQVAAISIGALAGVVVANVVTGGLITPVLMSGAGGAGVMAHGVGWMAVKGGVTAVGAVAGGYGGDWVYQQQ
jgi:hypothetical protein